MKRNVKTIINLNLPFIGLGIAWLISAFIALTKGEIIRFPSLLMTTMFFAQWVYLIFYFVGIIIATIKTYLAVSGSYLVRIGLTLFTLFIHICLLISFWYLFAVFANW